MDKNKVELKDEELENAAGGTHANGVIMVGGLRPPLSAECPFCSEPLSYYPENVDGDGFIVCKCGQKVHVTLH